MYVLYWEGSMGAVSMWKCSFSLFLRSDFPLLAPTQKRCMLLITTHSPLKMATKPTNSSAVQFFFLSSPGLCAEPSTGRKMRKVRGSIENRKVGDKAGVFSWIFLI